MLDFFCFTKLFTVWHKCPSKASLSRRIRVLEENTTWNLDRLSIQLASMDSRFFPKTISAWNGLAFAEPPSLVVFRLNFLLNECVFFLYNTLEGFCGILKQN